MQKDLLRLSSRLDPQDSSSPLTPPSSASPASSALSRRWRAGSPWPGAEVLDQPDDTFSIEREARLHRQAAGMRDALDLHHCSSTVPEYRLSLISSAVNEATFTWSGQLPPRNNKDPLYSCKVFLGGVPWDITEGNGDLTLFPSC